MSLATQLATNIRSRRGDLSQAAYARKLGISQSTLQRLECAEQNTTLATLETIMKALKCELPDLFSDISSSPRRR